jgi:hypothetical protein
VKEFLALVVAIALLAAGWCLGSAHVNGEMTKLSVAHKAAIDEATRAKDAADARADEANKAATGAIESATLYFTEERKNDKALDDRRIADLTADVVRLRVSTRRTNTGGCSALPAAAASAGGGDGEADETLAPAVAARLARRYADYNEVVDQLSLCQAVITIDRK